MPTPMHVYVQIAARYGVNPADADAVDRFFLEGVPKFPANLQRLILDELLRYETEGDYVGHPENAGSAEDMAAAIVPDPMNVGGVLRGHRFVARSLLGTPMAGATVGSLLGGPLGAVVGAVVGAAIGASKDSGESEGKKR